MYCSQIPQTLGVSTGNNASIPLNSSTTNIAFKGDTLELEAAEVTIESFGSLCGLHRILLYGV